MKTENEALEVGGFALEVLAIAIAIIFAIWVAGSAFFWLLSLIAPFPVF